MTGAITASSFKATGTTPTLTYTIIDDNIVLYNKYSALSCYIMVKDEVTHQQAYMHRDGLTFTDSGSGNYTKNMSVDSSGFTFSTRVKAPYLSFNQYIYRYDSNGTEVPVITGNDSSLYLGIHADYKLIMPNTILRGGQIRIYTVGTTDDKAGIYLGVSGATAVESDERIKDIQAIDDRYESFFNALIPVAYKYKVGHRKHLGFGAQSVEQALKDSGLNTEEFAGLIIQKDLDLPEDEIITPDNQKHFDELYSLRYEEFIALNTMMIQKLQNEIKSLRNELNRKELKG